MSYNERIFGSFSKDIGSFNFDSRAHIRTPNWRTVFQFKSLCVICTESNKAHVFSLEHLVFYIEHIEYRVEHGRGRVVVIFDLESLHIKLVITNIGR